MVRTGLNESILLRVTYFIKLIEKIIIQDDK